MFYGFDKIQDKLMHLNYDFENVNMSLQLFQILYYSFGKSCLYPWKFPHGTFVIGYQTQSYKSK